MSKQKRKPPIAAKLPPGAELIEQPPLTRQELIMALTTKLPADYESLDDGKKERIEIVLENLYHGQGLKAACESGGMSTVTFYRMRRRYAWIQESMDTIVESRLQVVEDTLYRTAIGYDYETVEQAQEEIIDANGNRVGNVKRRGTKKQVHVGPNTTSVIFFLKNRSSGKWRSDHHIKLESSHTERQEVVIDMEVKQMVANMSTEDLRAMRDIGARLQKGAQNKIDDDTTPAAADDNS